MRYDKLARIGTGKSIHIATVDKDSRDNDYTATYCGSEVNARFIRNPRIIGKVQNMEQITCKKCLKVFKNMSSLEGSLQGEELQEITMETEAYKVVGSFDWEKTFDTTERRQEVLRKADEFCREKKFEYVKFMKLICAELNDRIYKK
ncbi:hypothetical protein [Bacillus cereus]|uniref:hypothetical protein n=1 Tax=Bacillus cereus TaxID=1396 RepID=UPI000BEDF302|nr:hypothetical protein [Bacillus cereus]PEE91350.1 hypothetical protein COM92_28865 [Bacillus cereus]PGN76101.1 hypothetical protein CN967_18525 [Bacillus cereus]